MLNTANIALAIGMTPMKMFPMIPRRAIVSHNSVLTMTGA